MIKLKIKPMSVNSCWQGRRFKAKGYIAYEKVVLLMLPRFKLPDPPYQLYLCFGFSNKASDIDNGIKPLLDILQKKYKFNDKMVYRMVVEKEIVKKGEEFILWEMTHIGI